MPSHRHPGSPNADADTPIRPWVVVNMAMTADGKIATSNRAVTSFGSPRDLRNLYRLRSTADAILCGARTVEQSHATLGNGGDEFRRRRLRAGRAEFPLRVVVSGSGSIASGAELWSHRFSPIVLLVTERARPRHEQLATLADHVWYCGSREIDFDGALSRLAAEFGVRRLIAEGGGEVNDALFRAGRVDELHLTVCPFIFGGRTAPSIADGLGFPRLADAARFRLRSCRQVGEELFLIYEAARRPVGEVSPAR